MGLDQHCLQLRVTLFGMLWGLAASANAASASLAHKDWILQCDNTRTCRAAGYQADGTDSRPVSLKITRDAGPNTPVTMHLALDSEDDVRSPVRMQVGAVRLNNLPINDGRPLSAEQAKLLLPTLLKQDVVKFQSLNETWELSLVGLNAVLLKMDEAQGRLGTPGALIRKGTRSEAEVLLALPMPEVRAVLPLANRAGDEVLAVAIWRTVNKDDYSGCNNSKDEPQIGVQRLTANTVLLSMGCSMGAYNYTELLWEAQDKPPYRVKLLHASGELDVATGSVSYSMKGRGLGDCWHVKTWYFTGREFTLAEEAADGMCRGFPGGAWQLPSYVSHVIQPANARANVQPKQKGNSK